MHKENIAQLLESCSWTTQELQAVIFIPH